MSTRISRFHVRPLTWACLGAVVVAVVVATAYFSAGHTRHGIAFVGLAVVAVGGAWFTSAPDKATRT